MTISQLVEWARGIKQRFPQHKEQIWDLISLCIDEVQDSGSEVHEVQLCYSDICDLARTAINEGLNIHHTQIYKVVKSVNNDGVIETHEGKKYILILKEIKDDTSKS